MTFQNRLVAGMMNYHLADAELAVENVQLAAAAAADVDVDVDVKNSPVVGIENIHEVEKHGAVATFAMAALAFEQDSVSNSSHGRTVVKLGSAV